MAVLLHLEHSDGLAITVLLPYCASADGITFDDLSATPADTLIWGRSLC